MEAKLTGGTQPTILGKVNPRELNERTFYYYCTLYLTEKIYEIIPITSNITYGSIAKLIGSIDPALFDDLHLETNKIILLNQIYAAFMMASEEQISKEFLYNIMCHLASYDPAQFDEDEEDDEVPNVRINHPGSGKRSFII